MRSRDSTPDNIPPGGSVASLAQSRPKGGGKANSRDKLRAAFNTPHPGDTGAPRDFGGPPKHDEWIVATLDQLELFDKNPRTTPNEKYQAIKDNIRANGLRQPLIVTQRPNAENFVVAYGGNTRLQILRELWQETGNERHYRQEVKYVPYPGEAALLAWHLGENNDRGALTFWDNARGYCALREEIAREEDREVSLREFGRILAERGEQASHQRLSRFDFAVSRLSALGALCESLSGELIKQLQPAFGPYDRLARLAPRTDEATLQSEAIDSGLARYAERHTGAATLRADAILEQLEEAIADHFGVDVTTLGRLCQLITKTEYGSWEELLEAAAPAQAHGDIGEPASAPVVTGGSPPPPTVTSCGNSAQGHSQAHAGSDFVAGDDQAPSPPGSPGPSTTHLGATPDPRPAAPGSTRPPEPSTDAGGADEGDAEGYWTEIAKALERSQAAAHKLLDHLGIAHILRTWDSMVGWWVEPDPQISPKGTHHHSAWHLLAGISGQWSPVAIQGLPRDSVWRRLLEKDTTLSNYERLRDVFVDKAAPGHAVWLEAVYAWGHPQVRDPHLATSVTKAWFQLLAAVHDVVALSPDYCAIPSGRTPPDSAFPPPNQGALH